MAEFQCATCLPDFIIKFSLDRIITVLLDYLTIQIAEYYIVITLASGLQ